MELEALGGDPQSLRAGVREQVRDHVHGVEVGDVAGLERTRGADLEDRHGVRRRRAALRDHQAVGVDHDAPAAGLPVSPALVLGDLDNDALRPGAAHGRRLHLGQRLDDALRRGPGLERELRAPSDVGRRDHGVGIGDLRADDVGVAHPERVAVEQRVDAVDAADDARDGECREGHAAPGQAR